MNIVAISDLHGQLPENLPRFDLLLIAGDICPVNDHSYSYQREWLSNTLVPWINNLSFNSVWSKVIFTPGNHDFYFERERPDSAQYKFEIQHPTNCRFVYLRNELYTFDYLEHGELKQLKIFGSPWCHRFGNWAFMNDDNFLKAKFNEIPEKVDILLTHDAPYGCSDICYQISATSGLSNLGSKPLRDAILRSQPKFCFHGHLHSSNHEPMFLGKTRVMNVSLLDESYQMSYEPRLVDSSVLDCEVEYRIDEEYVLYNRFNKLIKLEKVNDALYKLVGDLSFATVTYNSDNESIYAIDPEGGPFLCIGSKWNNFVIRSITDVGNTVLVEIEKDELSS